MTASKKKGVLYLVPTPLHDGGFNGIPEVNKTIVAGCQYFIAESMKMGRRHILNMSPEKEIDRCIIDLMNKDTDPFIYRRYLDPALAGFDICLLSDAGSPTIADPGAPIVLMAHKKGIQVRPLSGPSSVMHALMASGLNGQKFTFHGYLSFHQKEVLRQLRELERKTRGGMTQIFMETPYRNRSLLSQILKLKPDTLLCIAANLSSPHEFIRTETIKTWSDSTIPDLHKIPCIFLLGY